MHNHIFTSKKISIDHKIRIFKVYAESVFLYNSELCVLTQTQEDKIDAFHRRLLRQIINIR